MLHNMFTRDARYSQTYVCELIDVQGVFKLFYAKCFVLLNVLLHAFLYSSVCFNNL